LKKLNWLLLAAPLLFAFTFANTVGPQTQRVIWHAWLKGTAYNTPAPRSTPFAIPFKTTGHNAAGGAAYYRADGIACDWAIGGTTDGGTNTVVVDIYHEDAGIDCSCTLSGDCTADGGSNTSCNCTQFQAQSGSTYQMELRDTTSCLVNPSQVHCTVDFFR
jgi:hypothetical protein